MGSRLVNRFDGAEGPDGSVGGRLPRGNVGRADRRRGGAGVCGPAFGACPADGLGFLRRLRGVANLAVPVVGSSLLPAARELNGLAVPRGGAGWVRDAYELHARAAAPRSLPAGQRASGCRWGWSRSAVACRMLMTYGARD